MVASACNLEKQHVRMSFSKTIKIARVRSRRVQFEVGLKKFSPSE